METQEPHHEPDPQRHPQPQGATDADTNYDRDLLRGTRQPTNWQDHLADGMRFASYAAPGKQVTGRDAYVESTKGFYSMIEDLELRQLIIDGDRACAQTRYALQPPRGERFTCDVAEFFTVRDDRIDSLEIYFDSAPFAR